MRPKANLMKKPESNVLPVSIDSYEEYEILKVKIEIFENAAKQIIRRHELPFGSTLTIFSEGTNIVFAHGDHSVIKIFPPFHYDQYKAELLVLEHINKKLSVMTPKVEYYGDVSGWPYIVMTKIQGTLLEELWDKMEFSNKIIIIRELGSLIHEAHSLPTHGLEEIDCHWPSFIDRQINSCMHKHQLDMPEPLLAQIPIYLESINELLININKPVFLTGEYTPMNILVSQIAGVWHIAGLIDFGDAMLGLPEYDLLGPGVFLIQGNKQLLIEFLAAYGYSQDRMTPTLSHQLTALTLLHKYSNLNIQIRIKDWKSRIHSLEDLQKLVWGL
jgi:hygromycin-B 7''-O-kinase